MKIPSVRFLYCVFLYAMLGWGTNISAQRQEMASFNNNDTTFIKQSIREAKKIYKVHPDKANVLLLQSLEQSLGLNFQKGIVTSISNLINIDILNKKYASALDKIGQLFLHCDTFENKDCLAIGYFYKGQVFQKTSKYNEAFEAYMAAADYSSSLPDAGNIYNNIGVVLDLLGETEKSLSFFDKAIALAKVNKQVSMLSYFYANKGKGLTALNRLEKSERYFDSAITYARESIDLEAWALGLSFKANLYIKKEMYGNALSILKEAESLHAENKTANHHYTRYLIYSYSGTAYSKLKQYKEAEYYFLKAKELKNMMSIGDYVAVLSRLSDLYDETGQYKKAYLYTKEIRYLLDSVKTKDVILEVNDLETKYRTAEKDKELAIKSMQISESEKRIAKKNNAILSVVFGAAMVSIMSILTYLYQRRKVKNEKEIEHLKGMIEGEEKERLRLAHDLHDGINSQLSAIQSFLLAEENTYPFLSEARNFQAAQNLLFETASGVRSIAHNLAPESLLTKGVSKSIQEFCNNAFNGRVNKADVDIYGDFEDIDSALLLSIYRITQEITQNILKHSHATEVTILLCREPEQITLIAEDNGRGIPKEVLQKEATNGIGLSSMLKRVKMHNGFLDIESSSSTGTTLHITFPVRKKTNYNSGSLS